jgi:hypothetical protein
MRQLPDCSNAKSRTARGVEKAEPNGNVDSDYNHGGSSTDICIDSLVPRQGLKRRGWSLWHRTRGSGSDRDPHKRDFSLASPANLLRLAAALSIDSLEARASAPPRRFYGFDANDQDMEVPRVVRANRRGVQHALHWVR